MSLARGFLSGLSLPQALNVLRERGFVHMGNNNSVKRIAAALGGVCFFGVFVCILYNIITIQYNFIKILLFLH